MSHSRARHGGGACESERTAYSHVIYKLENETQRLAILVTNMKGLNPLGAQVGLVESPREIPGERKKPMFHEERMRNFEGIHLGASSSGVLVQSILSLA